MIEWVLEKNQAYPLGLTLEFHGSDINPYLMAMHQAVVQGWLPPTQITQEMYDFGKSLLQSIWTLPHVFQQSAKVQILESAKAQLIGYVGFAFDQHGKFFHGPYHVPSGGPSTELDCEIFMSRKELFRYVHLSCCDYRMIPDKLLAERTILYCDIPRPMVDPSHYNKDFDESEFWRWANDKKTRCTLFVSAYDAPPGWKLIWQQVKKTRRRDLNAKQIPKRDAQGRLQGAKRVIIRPTRLEGLYMPDRS